MFDYYSTWVDEAAAILEVETWPQRPGSRDASNVFQWDRSICVPGVTVNRKTGFDVNGDEIVVPVVGFHLSIGLQEYRTFLANRPSIRIIWNRDTRRIRLFNGVTKAQILNLRISPVILGTRYDQQNPTYEDGV